MSKSTQQLGACTDVSLALGVLNGIQEQIRFADTKAAFVLGLDTLMIGFITFVAPLVIKAMRVETVSLTAKVALSALVLFALVVATAVILLICAVISRFGRSAPKSRLFFGHIATHYPRDYDKYVDEIKSMTESDWLSEIGTQIVETSHIANYKHSKVATAAKLTLVALVAWIITVTTAMMLPQ